ncbi:MAG: HD domain-containing protein [Desulfobacterales bacterium]
MDRIETIRKAVDEILLGRSEADHRRHGYVHLYGVSLIAGLLAKKRHLDVELAVISGMLHDISTYRDGTHEGHHAKSALLASEILLKTGLFAPHEMESVANAIGKHGRKGLTDGALDELLKDADVMHHYFYNPFWSPIGKEIPRIKKLGDELGFGMDASP